MLFTFIILNKRVFMPPIPDQSLKLKDERLKANIELLELLRSLVYSYPDLRFSQILSNFDFVKQNIHTINNGGIGNNWSSWSDEYYLEPKLLVQRVKLAIQKVNPE